MLLTAENALAHEYFTTAIWIEPDSTNVLNFERARAVWASTQAVWGERVCKALVSDIISEYNPDIVVCKEPLNILHPAQYAPTLMEVDRKVWKEMCPGIDTPTADYTYWRFFPHRLLSCFEEQSKVKPTTTPIICQVFWVEYLFDVHNDNFVLKLILEPRITHIRKEPAIPQYISYEGMCYTASKIISKSDATRSGLALTASIKQVLSFMKDYMV